MERVARVVLALRCILGVAQVPGGALTGCSSRLHVSVVSTSRVKTPSVIWKWATRVLCLTVVRVLSRVPWWVVVVDACRVWWSYWLIKRVMPGFIATDVTKRSSISLMNLTCTNNPLPAPARPWGSSPLPQHSISWSPRVRRG